MKFSECPHQEKKAQECSDQLLAETLQRTIDLLGLKDVVDRNLGKAMDEAVEDLKHLPPANDRAALLTFTLIQCMAATYSVDEIKNKGN